MSRIFLQAEWRKLAMANYAIDNEKPKSVFLAEGSEIVVKEGRGI